MVAKSSSETVLRIGYPATWGTLSPSQQHTAFADAILGNQFDTLVRLGREGLPRPLSARSWEVSPDSRVYKFNIDTSKQFSDGSHLKAADFKDSWERGLLEIPTSANNSLKDVLYNVEGFDDFERTHALSGVIVHSNEILEVRFKKPFRMALDHLSGSRFAAFKKDGDKLLGTGRYQIVQSSDQEVTLIRNKFYSQPNSFDRIVVRVHDVNLGASAVEDGTLDVFAYFARMANTPCKSEGALDCFTGAETGHVAANLNGMNGRFFENKNRRLAMQALIQKVLRSESIRPYAGNSTIVLDPQTFLPLQAGHIDESKAQELVAAGASHIPELVEASQKNPIFFVSMRDDSDLLAALRKEGVAFSEKSGNVDFKVGLQMHYKTFEPDILVGAFSVANGDPDGIYHLLGKQGAISTPMIHRESVNQLLEQGRSIIDRDEMRRHYESLAEVILQEVPFVHIGFTMGQVAYNTSRVAVADHLKTREDVGFHIYSPR